MEPPEDEGQTFAKAIERMQHAWINESNAPEILQYEEQLVHRLMTKLEEQTRLIESSENPLLRELYTMEVDRIKYVVRAYLRARLHKLEGLVSYQLSRSMSPQRLSKHELDFARRYKSAFENHMQRAFLSSIPQHQQRLDEANALGNMIPEPNFDTFVFARIRVTLGNFQLEAGSDEVITLEEGDIYMMRYRILMPLLEQRQAELI